jgi:hypothetical protein
MRTVVLLSGAAAVLALGCSSSSGTETTGSVSDALSVHPIPNPRPFPLPPSSPYLTIDGIEVGTSGSPVEDAVPVENRPFYVHFTVVNSGSSPLTGYVGGTTIPVAAGVPEESSYEGTDWEIWNLAPGASQSGVVALTAARAGLSWGVNVFFYTAPVLAGEFYTQGPAVFSSTARTDVAARYRASIAGMTINRTRSSQTDTDYVTLTGAYAGVQDGTSPGGLMPMANLWPTPQQPQVYIGDVQDGFHDLSASGIATVPFDSVPGRSPSPALSFLILNEGSTAADTAKTVLDDISSITQMVLTAVYPGSAAAWSQGNSATQSINSILSDCNGVAAVYDIPAIASTDLEVQTRGGPITQTVGLDGDKLGPPYNSPVICGKAAYYDVSWTYTRLTDPSDTLAFNPATVRANPGQTIHLSINQPTSGVEWSLEGNFRTSMIAQDGTLHLDPKVVASDGVVAVARLGTATARAWINVVPLTYILPGPIHFPGL